MNIDVRDTALMRYLQAQSAIYYGKALELRDVVQGWLNYIPETFPHYTRHTIQHSEEIIAQISRLLFDEGADQPIVRLTPMEAYVPIAAAYLHDAGMVAADAEKLEIMTSDPDWLEWVSHGGGAPRWREIERIRSGTSLTTSARHFVADLQTRFLLAEFVRRRHHLRAGDVIRLYEHELGRFAFNDQMLKRTIADVCIAHGLRHFELDESERFPERRDIQGHTVNVRLMAILLRLGDLLDLSYDRACPLLMNAASPIPAESLAHWTQYQRLVHQATSPRRIEITAECENQNEHRVLADWCQWIVEEIRNARDLMSHSASNWQPPQASMFGTDTTIKIRPTATANYIPSAWTFEMDRDSVLELLSRDLYQNPLTFIRELIQNAIDANRCQMYIDLRRQQLLEPEYPTAVDERLRNRYPVTIKIESRQIRNALSGETEDKQFFIIEDHGVGMDRGIIENYFLQVGRSYYTTEEFRRHYRFAPTSRFGVGFLSVFAVSDNVTIETYKPSSPTAVPVRLTIAGPRNYLLTERGTQETSGTRIEVQIREALSEQKVLDAIIGWCKRVEFPIAVQTDGTQQTILAEKASDYEFERADMTSENAQLFVKAFPLNRAGLEGEIYVFGRRDANGESWASSFVRSDEDLHPTGDEKSVPGSLVCFHGIAMTDYVVEEAMFHEHIFANRKASFRLDIRDKHFEPSLFRGWNYMLAEEHKEAIRDRLIDALREHLATTTLNTGENSWKYKNELAQEYKLMSFWRSCPGLVPVYHERQFSPVSLNEVRSVELLTTIHRLFDDRYDFVRPEHEKHTTSVCDTQQLDVMLGSDLLLLDGKIASDLLDHRLPSIQEIENSMIEITWRSAEATLVDSSRIFSSEKHRGYRFYVGLGVGDIPNERHIAYFLSGRKYPMYWVRTLWNINNPFVAWLNRVKEIRQDGELDLGRQVAKIFSFINSYGSGHGGRMNLTKLDTYLKGWKELPNIPDEFYPPEIDIAEDMFAFLG